jgi:hypothetical protein
MKHSFKILSDESPDKLAARVENDLNTGWTLHGPPFVIKALHLSTFAKIAQAMVCVQPGQHTNTPQKGYCGED